MPKNAPNLIWERPERRPRPVPTALTREAIVQAAIALADAEGLAAVTLRNVAAALGAGPMRLYGYMATKEDLLALMVDTVYAEMLGSAGTMGSWRTQVTELARGMRDAALRHPWFATLLGGRPHQGPNALAFLEALLAAMRNSPDLDGIDAVFQAAKLVNAFVLGTIRDEAAEAIAVRESGLTKAEWQEANWPYLERMVATGRFPMIASVVRDVEHPTPERQFNQGLETVLDGIARHSAARASVA